MRAFVAGPCPVLAERDAELRLLSDGARSAVASGACLVLVTGEPGAGKTRLCREFVESLPENWQRASARGEEDIDALPFRSLVPDVPAGEEPARALGEALGSALAARATASPVVAVLEDLHAVDPVGLQALPHALRVMGPAPVLVLGTYRLGIHGPGSPHFRSVGAILRRPGASELRLGPLSPRGIGEMARAMQVQRLSDDPVALETLHRTTAGNAFYVEEVLRSPDPEIPWTITEAVTARFEGLSEAAVRVARLLALARAPLSLHLLDTLVVDADEGVSALIDAALAVDVDAGAVALRHALVADALERNTPARQRRELHRSLASALEVQGIAPERLTRHWREAGEMERAAQYAKAAAEDAGERRAYRTATELYRIALTSPPRQVVERADLYEQAAAAAAMAGSLEDALAWAEQAEVAGRAAGQEWRAVTLWLNPALAQVPRGGAGRGSEQSSERSPGVLVADAQRALRESDRDGASKLASKALALLGAQGSTDLRRLAAMTLFYAGDVEAGRHGLETVRREAEAEGDARQFAFALSDLARVAWALGEIEQATELDRQSLAAARREPEAMFWPQMQMGLACIAAIRGDFDECGALIAELEALTQLPILSDLLRWVAALIDLEQGRLDRAREPIEMGVALRTFVDVPLFVTLALLARARLRLLAGQPELARGDLAESATTIGGVIEEASADRLLLSARVAEALGDQAELAAAQFAINEVGRFAGGPGVAAAAEAVAAISARAGLALAEAGVRFESAALLWERTPRLPLAAEAWCEAAEVSIAARHPGQAEAALERALAISERLGLDPLLRRIGSAHRAMDALVPSVPTELGRLTLREVEIARLVGAGRTNRQIAEALHISELTARNHLGSIFTKLGLSRRSEVAALAARVGLE